MRKFFFVVIAFIVFIVLVPVIIVTREEVRIEGDDVNEDSDATEIEVIESDLMIKVYNHRTSEIMSLYLEDYIVNVVAAEMPASFELEALKAQAVAARTYAIWKKNMHGKEGDPAHSGAILCTDHAHCQEWLSNDELAKIHGKLWIYIYLPRIKESVKNTRGIIMTYNMKPIEPLYHSTSGGKTENSEDVFSNKVSYLRSVPSPFEERSPSLLNEKKLSVNEFINMMKTHSKNFEINEKKLGTQIEIIERSRGGSVQEIKIGNQTFKGTEIRKIFQLKAADFVIEIDKNHLTFTTKGHGHGVGMSQWGANGMAERGSNFKQILKHYYQGITLSRLK
ncbi:MAG: stage II sporulation protein D [Alkaliphilus sp.]|nr:stage II sporulation protein D [bacterium AH-315-L21]MBN4062572.1 stage II sporulation protein D [Alkaliphilus sp. AH-315-G20]MBN4074561.1 stage II sporulation protein D [bacterium AH-315-E09]PHS35374.1 MAG: stage II sporulation protein D [Alkaliphilus sp.]